MPDLEDTVEVQSTGIFGNAYDDDDLVNYNTPYAYHVVGAEVDFNNMEPSTVVSPIPTTRIHSIHPKDQIIRDPKSAVQTKGMTKKSSREQAMISYILKQQRTNHKDLPEPFNDTYEPPRHTKKVFSNMARQSKSFSGKITPLFESMLVQNQAPEGKRSVTPPEPQPTPSTSQPNVLEPQTEPLQTETPPTISHEPQTEANIEQILPSPSTYQRKHRKTQKHMRAKKVTKLPQTCVPLDLRADEAVHKEGVTVWQSQALRNHGGAPAQTRSERVLKQPNEPPLPEGHTSGSGEGRMEHTFEFMDTVPPTPYDSPLSRGYIPRSDKGRLKLEELMTMCIKLSKHVLDLEKEKDAQAVEILKLKKRVKKLERQRNSSISHPRRRIYRQVESSDDDLDEEDASKQGRTSDKTNPMFKDNDFDGLDDDMENIEEYTVYAATTGVGTVDQVSTARPEVSVATLSTPPTTTTISTPHTACILVLVFWKALENDVYCFDVTISLNGFSGSQFNIFLKPYVEEASRLNRSNTTLQPLLTIDLKDKGKGVLVEEEPEKIEKIKRRDQGLAQIESDAELAQRLHEEELAELDRAQKERLKQEEATNVALAKEFDEIQARIDADHEMVVRLTHKEQEKYTIEERARLLAEFFQRRKKQLAAERAEAIRNKPPTRAQVRNMMITYLKHMGKYTHQQLKHKNFKELQKLYQKEQKWIYDFKPIDSEEDGSNIKKAGKRIKRVAGSTSEQKSPKKSKVIKEQESAESDEEATAEYEQEKEELRMWLAVVPDEEENVDPEILSAKYPIVNWESQNLGSDIHVYKIIRADGNTSYHKIFFSMLRKFDRQDLVDLQRLVMKRFEDNTPEGYNLLLWGDLKVMFEPNAEDEIWMEKRYPLIKEMLEKMLNWKLEAEAESTMAFKLLKFIKSQVHLLVNTINNTKFLNSLPPEWSKFVTDVKLVKDLHTSNFDQLYAYLEQHELHANEVHLMRERNQDPLAFVANQQMTPPHFNTYQSSFNNPQLQQQFSPSQFGSIQPNQHYSSHYPSQTQFNHSSIPPSHTFQSQMNHITSSVPHVIP
ncbi:hypothetical protein Tco_0667229 [Tanacetum coccineum]